MLGPQLPPSPPAASPDPTPPSLISLGVERDAWAFSTGNRLETSHLLCLNGEQRGAAQSWPGESWQAQNQTGSFLQAPKLLAWLTKDSR